MRRREDWPERLAEYLDARRETRFAWGRQDCSTFAAGAVEAMTDETLAIPRVESAAGYLRLMRDHGPLDAMVDDILGPQIVPALAQRGDVVLIFAEGQLTLGVCIGAEAAAPGESGMLTVPMSAARAAWRV